MCAPNILGFFRYPFLTTRITHEPNCLNQNNLNTRTPRVTPGCWLAHDGRRSCGGQRARRGWRLRRWWRARGKQPSRGRRRRRLGGRGGQCVKHTSSVVQGWYWVHGTQHLLGPRLRCACAGQWAHMRQYQHFNCIAAVLVILASSAFWTHTYSTVWIYTRPVLPSVTCEMP